MNLWTPLFFVAIAWEAWASLWTLGSVPWRI